MNRHACFRADPNFVSSFHHDGMVYFFFRETAVENINCGKVRNGRRNRRFSVLLTL